MNRNEHWSPLISWPMAMGPRLMTDGRPDRDLTIFYAPFPLLTLAETKCTNFAKMQPSIAELRAAENCRDLRPRSWCPSPACLPAPGASSASGNPSVCQIISKNQLFINKAFLSMHLIGCPTQAKWHNQTLFTMNGIFASMILISLLITCLTLLPVAPQSVLSDSSHYYPTHPT